MESVDEPLSSPPSPTESLPARAIVAVAFAALVLAQILTPRSVSFGFALAVVPLAAAFWYGPIGTTLYGAAALAVLAVVPAGQAKHVDRADHLVLILLAAGAATTAWRRRSREARLVRTTHIADVAQYAVLAAPPARVGPLACAALYEPAERDTRIGGDFHEVCQGPSGVRAVVGDVQGHGLAVVGVVAALLGAFREGALDDPDLAAIAARLERRVNLAKEPGSERFATAVLLEFAADGSWVRILTLGHPSPLLLTNGRAFEIPCTPMPPVGLGLFAVVDAWPFTQPLLHGDVLLAYTDGVTEARDATGAFYPLTDRVAGVPSDDPASLLDHLWSDLRRYAPVLADDVALLALRVDGVSAAEGDGDAG